MSKSDKQFEAMVKLRDQIMKADEDVIKFGEGFIRFTNDGCEHIPFHRVIVSPEEKGQADG